jgi:hypothetical protein
MQFYFFLAFVLQKQAQHAPPYKSSSLIGSYPYDQEFLQTKDFSASLRKINDSQMLESIRES